MLNSVKITKIDLANNLTIDRQNKIIRVTKQLYNAAKKYGSDECKLFGELMEKYSDYQILVNHVKRRNSIRITFDFMTKYISAHDEDGTIMEEFLFKRGLKGTNENVESYLEIKKWFIKLFPEVKELNNKAV